MLCPWFSRYATAVFFLLRVTGAQAHYDRQYKRYIDHGGPTTAVLVIAYNRPDYLKLCIEALERNPESQVWPFIFALDGGERSCQADNERIIADSSIKHKIVLKRSRNYGCIKNYIDAKRFAFDWCNFDRILVIEDDVVVTDSYCTLMHNVHTWATQRFDNIGALQGWSYCFLSRSEKQQKLACVEENPLCWSFVTYCMDQRTWKKIRPILYKFEAFVDQVPTDEEGDRVRSCLTRWGGMPKIKKWVHKLIRKMARRKQKEVITDTGRVLQSRYTEQFKKIYLSPRFNAAIDVVLGLSLYVHDLIKLRTVVNRAIHIGKRGMNTNAQTFYEQGYHNILLDQFAEDVGLRCFNLG